jgi:chemotaxis protein MotB
MAGKKKKEESGGAPDWIVTFSDLMSLLLTFFVLLLSFSTISEEKFERALLSLQGAFGVMPRNSSILSMAPKPAKSRKDEKAVKMARELQRKLLIADKTKQVRIQYDAQGGLKLSLPNAALFETGSSALKAESYPLFQEIAETLVELPGAFFEVRGHTDASPMSDTTRYSDNRDLSYFRAKSVTERLVSVGGVPQQQFEIVALGETQPLATNATPEGRSANRRVEIYVRGLVEKSKIEPLREKFSGLTGLETPSRIPTSPEHLEELR